MLPRNKPPTICRRSILRTRYLVLSTLFAIALGATLPAQDDVASQEESAIRAAVERVAPAVVKIETIGGLERVGKVLISTGPTTGLIVDEAGYVLSSAFNFIQKPSSILVTLPSGARAPAQIVARDNSRMLVLLKVNTGEKLTPPVAAPKSEMTVGQWAIAVGRTYDQPLPNVSVGVLSATGRIWSTAIQTDAKISPANYGGPLIDIQGRVLGILVPLSPQRGGGEVAGAEWYDSGIGFAIPLADVLPHLPTLKAGKDLHAGVMGIILKQGDRYALPAELAATHPLSPAYKAGLKAGDTIIEVDGTPITRQAQLQHALGPRYAGERVHLVFMRGASSKDKSGNEKDKSEKREIDIELIDKLIPYEHPFLGILPLRATSDTAGVRVRYVYPGSPAATAGIKTGDAILEFGDEKVADAAQLRAAVANLEPKAKAKLKFQRDGETLAIEITPAKLPTDIPGELPPPTKEPLPPPAEKTTTGIVEIKLPEEKNECVAFVPDNYHSQMPHGLIVVISAPGAVDRDKLAARWKTVCEERNLIVLAPMSAAADKWQPTETDFIRKTIDDVIAHYNIDTTRIATYGYQTGGSLGFLVGFEHIDRVRAIIAIDAVPPNRTKLPETDPINRLAFFIGAAEKSVTAPLMKTLYAALEGLKFPITKKSLGEKPRDLNEEELTDLGRWLDALDRI
jgi:serine protease Do